MARSIAPWSEAPHVTSEAIFQGQSDRGLERCFRCGEKQIGLQKCVSVVPVKMFLHIGKMSHTPAGKKWDPISMPGQGTTLGKRPGMGGVIRRLSLTTASCYPRDEYLTRITQCMPITHQITQTGKPSPVKFRRKYPPYCATFERS